MIHRIPQIRRYLPKFNIDEVTEKDFWRVVRNENIYVQFWKLGFGVKGFFGINRRYKIPRKYIVINSELLPNNWFKTALHELFHFILHIPESDLVVFFSSENISEAQDNEADDFALIGMMPREHLIDLARTPVDEIFGFTNEELIRRKEIFDESQGKI